MKLTKSIIDELKYTGDAAKNEKCIVWADEPSGFGVRIYPSGKKAFVHSYYFQGRKQLKTIGKYGDITLSRAIEEARKDKVSLLDRKNPLDERRKALLGETIRDLCNTYIEKYAPQKKTGAEDIRRINQHILPAWAAHKIKSITRKDVDALHAKIGAVAPYEANRTLSLLSKMFNLASGKFEMLEPGHPNPAQGIDKFPEVKRDRFVTGDEMPQLIEAIDNEQNQSARFALWLYLLTGLRKEELLAAKWSDIDSSRNELRIEDTKNGTNHHCPLSSAAVALLDTIPRVTGNPYIIVGKNEGAHLVNIDKAWGRVRKAAGVEDVRIHDLRRSVGSWLAQAGNSLHLIGRVLNHSSVTTTAIYARFQQNHLEEALERHGDKMMTAAGMTQSGDVLEFKQARK